MVKLRIKAVFFFQKQGPSTSHSFWAHKVANDSNYSILKGDILGMCTQGLGYAPCTIGTTLAELDREMILKLCQWHDVFDNICSSDAPNYKESIRRFSRWTDFTVNGVLKMTEFKRARMSSGYGVTVKPPLSLPGTYPYISMDWQTEAIHKGRWPDGSKIYRLSGSNISDLSVVDCHNDLAQGCQIRYNFSNDREHIHHIHIQR